MAWTTVHDEVFKKVNQEMDEYQGRMQNQPGQVVYNHAEEIAAMGFCYNQLMSGFHDYQAEDLAPLLHQEKPLEALCQLWMSERNYDPSGEFERVLWSLRNPQTEEQIGPAMC